MSRLKKAEKAMKNIPREDLEKMQVILPNSDDYIDLYTYFDKFVADNGLFLRSIKFSKQEYHKHEKDFSGTQGKADKDEPEKEISKLFIFLDISGLDYGKLKNFLKSIETNLRIIDIKSFNFSSLKNGILTVQAVTYYDFQDNTQEKESNTKATQNKE